MLYFNNLVVPATLLLSILHFGSAVPTATVGADDFVLVPFDPANVDLTSTFGVDNDTSPATPLVKARSDELEKRSQRPDQCWEWVRGTSGTLQQYKNDLGTLRARLASSSQFLTMAPLSTYISTEGTARVTVRNQDSCASMNIGASTVAYFIRQMEDYCSDHSGWIARAGYRDVIIITEATGVAPPAYSPRCNYY